MPLKLIEPENPYKYAAPNRKNAEEKAPNKKYLRAASCEANRRRRESPAIKYRGNESISNATNKVIKSLATGNKSIPATANKVRG